jgi:class 3 adenylate cyclase/tetratricopeptide (TPR) repeat protein
MMRCPGCQLDNREGAKFCKECGTKLERKCPSCGYRFESDALFCDECGYYFAAPKAPLRIDYSRPESYTPKFLADIILNTRSAVEGERKVVTVFFADVANYTAIAEKCDPEEVHQIMDGCFKILMDGIHRYEGTINQFTGDGIMAIFGAPIAHENHAQRACYSALSIQRAIEDYGDKLRADCGLEFKMRFGINSGLVMVGAIGNDLRMDYTADGDTTNLASRLESIAEPGSVLVSENTYRLIKAYFKLKALGPVTLKGKEEPQNAYLLIDSTSVKTRFEEAVSKGLVRFVGRKNSMATLRNIWNRATDGFGQVLGIMGEPGVGKSRLMLEFKRSLADDDIHFLQGRCLPHGGSIAYLPFLDILKAHFSIKEGQDDSGSTKNIKEKITFMDKKTSPFMLSAFQQLLSLKTDDESWHALEPKKRRYHIFETIKCLFIRMSQEKPLVILVDDLQWMDKTSEEFLSYFIDSISQNPILLVLLYRPEYSHPWEKKSYYCRIGLGQLTEKSSLELISAVLEEGAAEDELEQLILRQSAGNPLFIEELIHSLRENHLIEKKNGRFVLVGRFDSMHIPDTIHGIVAARIDKLDDTLKRITQAASVIGHNFGYRLLQTITGMGEELKSSLDKLQSVELIYEKALFPEPEYAFKHSLIQEVAYGTLLLKRRVGLHVKIGLALESLYADKLDEFYEILAHHFLVGEEYPKAHQYLKLSGNKAEFNFSHLEALHFFEKALRTSDKLATQGEINAEKLEIYNLMRRPLAMLGYPQNALKVLTEGVDLATAMGDQKSLARFHNYISLLYTARGESLLSIAHSEKSFHEAAKIEDIEIMAPLALPLCYAYITSCKYKELIYVSSKVAESIKRLGREADSFNTPFHLYSFLLGLCGTGLGMLGDFKKAEVDCQKGLDHAVRSGHKMTLAFAELQCATILVMKGEGKNAIAHCQRSVEFCKDIGWVTILSQAWTILGYSHYLLGELDRAREFVGKGLKIQEDSKIEAMLSLHYWVLAMVLFDEGDLEEALRSSEKALELSIYKNERRYEGLSRIWIGRILGGKEKRRYREGEQFILEGCLVLKELGLRPAVAQGHFYLGELYRNAGDESKAVEHLNTARSMFEEMEMDYWTAKSREALKGS